MLSHGSPIPSASALDNARLAWLEHVWDRLRGRPACAELAALVRTAGDRASATRADLDRLLRIVAGRRLTATVVGDDRWRQSLTDVFQRGRLQAAHLLPYMKSGDAVLEYGGGFGRLGRAVRPEVARLVSVDVDPLMAAYGARLNPDVEFVDRDALPDAPVFDGAYSVAVFSHLPADEQRRALEYVHRRLKPGGWLLLDLQIGTRAAPAARSTSGTYGDVRPTSLDAFRSAYEPLFGARRVSLFNSGFLLTKAGTGPLPDADLEGRHGVNEASIVYDVLEGEVVVVNLDSGSYYIMQGTASPIWQRLAAGQRVDEIVDALAAQYTGSARHDVQSAVDDFVAQIMAESLLVPAAAPPAPFSLAGAGATPGEGFTTPVMYRYTDMQALIQMDPIREFDESGWPSRPART